MLKLKPEIQLNRHTLFQWFSPHELNRMLKVYPGEAKLLLWVTLIQTVMSVSSILVNNVAQATFLKRFGTEALPAIFLAEAVITFFFAGLVSLVMSHFRSIRVFTSLLIFYAVAMGCVRVMVSLGIDLAYPILYILKSQAMGILPILYWDILSDLFTTRQSKRLYTLISAGGILGTTLGSLMTKRISVWIGIDNILVLFVGGMLLTAILNETTEKVVKLPVQARTRQSKTSGNHRGWGQMKAVLAYAKTSPLLTYLVLLLAIPNILLPILDYQFNLIVDAQFASEGNTLQFFGIFRGISNAAIFLLLMVSNRIITKWGVPNSLLLHPVNYCFSFVLMFFSFTMVAGAYARFSTEMIKTVLNNPARAVLYNFFPEKIRGSIRVVLRGGVVRIADFTGSGFLILMAGFSEPRILSGIAVGLSLVWVITAFRLRKAYPEILFKTLETGHKPWKTMESSQIRILSSDRRATDTFVRGLSSARREAVLLSSEFLSSARPDGWVRYIINALPLIEADLQEKLLSQLDPDDVRPFLKSLHSQVLSVPVEHQHFWLDALVRLDPEGSSIILDKFSKEGEPEIRNNAINLLAFTNKSSDDLLMLLTNDGEEQLPPGMRRLGLHLLVSRGIMPPPEVLTIILKSADPGLRHYVIELLACQESESIPVLLQSLADPSRKLREESSKILSDIGVAGTQFSAFAMDTIKEICRYLSLADRIEKFGKTPSLILLVQHLMEKKEKLIEVVLRVVGILEFKDRMDVILRAIQSNRQQDMDNAVELLESELHGKIAGALIPLLEKKQKQGSKEAGCGLLLQEEEDELPLSSLLHQLMDDPDPTVVGLGLCAMGESLNPEYSVSIKSFFSHDKAVIRRCAQDAFCVLETMPEKTSIPLIENLQALVDNPLFIGLKVEALILAASLCRRKVVSAGETFIKKGDQSPWIVLLVTGKIKLEEHSDVSSAQSGTALAGLSDVRFAGEMPWIDGGLSPYDVSAVESSIIMELDGRYFQNLLLSYPVISFNLCRIYSRQLRSFHQGYLETCHD